MKYSHTLVLVSLVLLTVGGFITGRWYADQEYSAARQLEATDQLATSLYMLEQLERGETKDVRRILEAATGPQFDWLITNGDLGEKPDQRKFRCLLARKLKEYRTRHGLFLGSDWAYLWTVPGMQAAETRRAEFIEKTAPRLCGWS